MENRSAAYERLSQDDGDKQESESIRSQRALIQQYVDNNPALHLVAEYADDGWSGTNFDRPDFKRMMDDAAKGRINCIIVKDLSRFGRNYIGMGKYMERILPSMGVRLIAINDNYDSAKNNDSDSIIVPFKNLINDSYSRDISTKIRSQLDVKRKRGDFIGNYAAYGYKRDENDHNRLVVDEYAAGIVRDIFNMKMEGLGCQTIADRLNERGVLSPMEYHRLQGVNLKTGFRGDGSPRWTSGQISPMLRNRVYIGTMQQGKRRKTNYKMKQLVDVPEEEWICVEGTHEAIIDPDVFERVQELLQLDTCTAKVPGDNIFTGIVRCADCGQNLVRRGGGGKRYLACCTYRDGLGCTSHLINEDELYFKTLDAINVMVEYVLKLEEMMGQVTETPAESRNDGAREHIRALEKEMDRYRHLRAQLYEDLNEGIITRDEYDEFHASFSAKLEAARQAKEQAEAELESFRTLDADSLGFLRIFKKYRHLAVLDRRAVVELIDSIVVKDKDHITINFRFADRIEGLARYCGIEQNNGQEDSE